MASQAIPTEAPGRAMDGWGPMLAASLFCHLLLAAWIWQLPAAPDLLPSTLVRSAGAAPTTTETSGDDRSRSAPLTPGGARSPQNVDAPNVGERGDATGAVEFMLLVSGAHGILLQDSPMNSPGPSQVQRIRTSRDRLSWENRRATPNPNDDPFLASGRGRHPERRTVASADARHGARIAPEASSLGGTRDQAAFDDGDSAFVAAPGRRGASSESPGRGIVNGRGQRASESARVAHGRPPVDEGPAATLAQYQGRVQDDTNAELLAGRLLQSIVDASERRGRAEGAGRGGVGGGGAPGSGGGSGEGGRASPYGPGSGSFAALDTSDRRYRRWYLQQRRRVEQALRYPRERALAMDQGTAVYRLTVARDGTLQGSPRSVRSTGFDDLDAAAVAAIRQAAPFAPLPADLLPEQPRIRIDLTVEFSNPMVR